MENRAIKRHPFCTNQKECILFLKILAYHVESQFGWHVYLENWITYLQKNGILLGSREKLKVKRSLRQRERVSKYAGLNIHFNQIYNILELRPSVADNKSIKYIWQKNKTRLNICIIMYLQKMNNYHCCFWLGEWNWRKGI